MSNKSTGLIEAMFHHDGIRINTFTSTTGRPLASLNFTRKVFQDGSWCDMTMRARGLIVDSDFEVVARGYNKFFNLGERNGFTRHDMETMFTDEVDIAVKHNGLLGLVTVIDGVLHVFTKSGITTHSQAAEKVLFDHLDDKKKWLLTELLDVTNTTLAVEFCLPNDPHIVREPHPMVVLDVIVNTVDTFIPRDDLAAKAASIMGVPYAKKTRVSLGEALEIIDGTMLSTEVEGLVVRDCAGRMTKIKTPYYIGVKKSRGLLGRVLKETNDGVDVTIDRFRELGGYNRAPQWVVDTIENYCVVNNATVSDVIIGHTVTNIGGAQEVNIPALMNSINAQETYNRFLNTEPPIVFS